MILTVTFNTAVDKTYNVPNFRIDRVHRPSDWYIVAGGKGVNVARVYGALGGSALATGYVGGHNGDFILESLSSEGMRHDFVRTRGESRVCIAVIDPVQKTQTELNEVGPTVSAEELAAFKAKFESLLPGMRYAVFSGSLPPGVPEDIYRELIETARAHGVESLLDASGAALSNGLAAVPFMVKPNIHELSAAVGRQITTVEESVEAAHELLAAGTKIIAVTFGREGALCATSEGVWWSRPPEIEFVSAVGSGDSFAAAFLHVLSSGGEIPEALALGNAAGAANAMKVGAGFCTKDEIMTLAEKTEVSRMRS